MNRRGFLAELRNLLAFMDANDRVRVLKRYENMFEEAGSSGEATLIRFLGSPVRQVLMIEQEYREALDRGETPFADEETTPSEPEEISAPEVPAQPLPAPETVPEPPIPESVLSEDKLSLRELFPELALPAEEESAPEPEENPPLFTDSQEIIRQEPEIGAEAKQKETNAEPKADILPEASLPAEEMAEEAGADLLWETDPEEDSPIQETASPVLLPKKEAPAEEEYEEDEQEFEDEGEYEEEEYEDEEEYDEDEDEDEDDEEPGGGRKFAAFLITIPMLLLWAICFGLSLALGTLVLAVGLGFGAAALYLTSYVFSGVISFTPDLILVAGGALLAAALALLLIWMGLWIAIGGCILTVRLSGRIYRAVLGKKREEE